MLLVFLQKHALPTSTVVKECGGELAENKHTINHHIPPQKSVSVQQSVPPPPYFRFL